MNLRELLTTVLAVFPGAFALGIVAPYMQVSVTNDVLLSEIICRF
jgi:hypothetical protein